MIILVDSETANLIDSQPISHIMKEMLVLNDGDTTSSVGIHPISMDRSLSTQFFGTSQGNLSTSPDNPSKLHNNTLFPMDASQNKTRTTRKFTWLSELDTFGFKFSGVIAVQKLQQILVPNYMTREEFLGSLDTKSSSVMKKISEAFKSDRKKAISQTEKTFGVPLNVVLDKYPSKIEMGYGPNPKTVPFIISESIKLMLKMGIYMKFYLFFIFRLKGRRNF